MTQEGLKERDRMVYSAIGSTGAVPLVVTMGGGYPRDTMGGGYPRDLAATSTPGQAFDAVVRTHANVYLELADHLAA